MVKQKDSVFAAFTSGVEAGLEPGSDALFNHMAAEVENGIRAGEVDYTKSRSDEKIVRTYSRSLISNWTKKDIRLTNGVKYVPATKRGPQVKDETLKALNTSLKSLKAHGGDMSLISRVETAIEQRRDSIQTAKAATKVQSLDQTLETLMSLGIEV